MPETLRFKPRPTPIPTVTVYPHELRGAVFIEALAKAVEQAETATQCQALYAVLARAEERIAQVTTSCMARLNLLEMKGQ